MNVTDLEKAMENQLEQQRNDFRQEARELLGELEIALLELEEAPKNRDLINRIFRSMHTIKGSGAMFGFDDIADFTHEIETAYDWVREGRMSVTKELINLSLSSGDVISEMLDASLGGETVAIEKTEGIISGIRALTPDAMDSGGADKAGSGGGPKTDLSSGGSEGEAMVTYRIRFRPSRDIFSSGTNPLLLLDELAKMGECHIVAHTSDIPLLSDLEPEACHVFWDIILSTDMGPDAVAEVFIFVPDGCEVSIREIDADDGDESLEAYKKLGEILVDRGDLPSGEIEKILSGRKRIGELLSETGIVSGDVVEAALMEQAHIRKNREKRMEAMRRASIRVDADKLDSLVDLVGELVTVQARLSRLAALGHNGELSGVGEEVERLVGELRDNTMSIRMRPIGTTFNRFKRLVRDLSEKLGKQVAFTTSGGETELDKTVIEQLNDPLVHIVRNSVDHGLETPEERARAGKPDVGKIHISAAHVGANVVIRIEDDGAGLDLDGIRASAIRKGLLSLDAELSEEETMALIFKPGFSTSETVTGVSGRGVGMDVVKKRVESLRGSIGLESVKGTGTTMTLELPLTLAIIEGFLVAVGDEHFVFPLAEVEECVQVEGAGLEIIRRRNILDIRDEAVPYLNLREIFNVGGAPVKSERIVVVETGGKRVGFGVDNIIGQHQTVIKSLGKISQYTRGISGATILGDGTVALILDMPQLIKTGDAVI